MSFNSEFYLVRHGEYDRSGNLSELGRELDAPSARDELIARGLGKTVLLSSDAPRAAQTAEIIGQGLGIDPILSRVINDAGNGAWSIKDLDSLIERELDNAGVYFEDAHHDLVVVTHAPMLAIAKGVGSRDINYGEVLAYSRNSWNNPDFPK